MKKIISIMLCIVLTASCICLPSMAEEAESGFEFVNYSRQLMTSGNKLVYVDDPDTMVTLRGVNVPSMGWGMQEHLYESLIETFDSWNGNIIRLPIGSYYWFGDVDEETGEYTGTYVKSGVTYRVAGYRAAVDAMVRGAAARGKYIIIDNHGYVLPNQKQLDMIIELCHLYGNNPAVLFGVLNEPHGKNWNQWYYGDPDNGYLGHQYMVEQIRDTGAKNILVVGGLSYAYNVGGILGVRDEETGATYELTDCGSDNDLSKSGYGIMYDTHIYPTKGSYSSWESTVGAMRRKYPILCGEWGWDSSDSTVTGNSSNIAEYWEQQLMNWMDDTLGDYDGVPMNWTAWNMHMSSTPKMITGWNFKPNNYHGIYVKNRLLSYPSTSLLRDETITVDFKNTSFRSYKASNTTNTQEDGKLTIAYNANKTYYSRLVLPIEWDMNGLQTLKMTLKGTAGHTVNIGFYGTDQEIYTKEIALSGEEQEISINVDEFEFDRSASKIDGELKCAVDAVQIGGVSTEKGAVEITAVSFVKSSNPTIKPAYVKELPKQDLFFDMEEGSATFSKYTPWKGASSADVMNYTFEQLEGYDGNQTTAIKVSYVYSGAWSGNLQLNFYSGVVPAGARYLSFMIKGTGDTYQKIQLAVGGYSVYPEIKQGDDGWQQFIYNLENDVPDAAEIKFIKLYAKYKVTDSFWLDNVSFTYDEPERLIKAPDEEVIIKTLPYTFERSMSYKYDVALKVKEGGDGDSISHQVINDGCASTKADRIVYTRGSGAPATAIISYSNDSDFFKAPDRTTWTSDMKYCKDIVFDIKSLSGEKQKIKLALYDSCSILSDYLDIEITDSWQRIRIPVASFTDPLSGYPMRPDIIRSYYFQGGEENTSGEFLVDNIILTNDPNLPDAESYLVEYVNDFDNGDLYQLNGGGWSASATAEAPDAEGDYFYAEYEPHSGVRNSGAMHMYNNWGKSDNTITVTGFPKDWDFSKAFYIGAMIKSGNMVNSAKKVPYVGKLSVKLYNGDTLTGTAGLYYSVGGWNWSEAAFSLNTKLKSNIEETIKGTDKMVICSDVSMTNEFYIDDLTFSYVPLKAQKAVNYPMDYRESFSVTGVTISTAWDKASSAEGFIKNIDNAGLVGDNGASIQFVYTDEMIVSGNSYVYWTPRDFWDIRRGEYFSFAASLMTDPSRKGRWKTKNINTHYPYSDDYCNETLDVTIAMTDVYGNVYKAPPVTLTSYATTYYKVPVEGFKDEFGNAPDFNKIIQMRMYPDTSVIGGCFWFDEFGFKNDSQYISSIVSDFIQNGVNALTDSVTVNFVNNAASAEKYTVIAAVYDKSDMSLYDIKYVTGDITADNLSLSLNGISLPEDKKDNYMIKFFVWEGDIKDMSQHTCELYLPATVNY